MFTKWLHKRMLPMISLYTAVLVLLMASLPVSASDEAAESANDIVAVTLSSNQPSYQEGQEIKIKVSYTVLSDIRSGQTLSLTIPEGIGDISLENLDETLAAEPDQTGYSLSFNRDIPAGTSGSFIICGVVGKTGGQSSLVFGTASQTISLPVESVDAEKEESQETYEENAESSNWTSSDNEPDTNSQQSNSDEDSSQQLLRQPLSAIRRAAAAASDASSHVHSVISSNSGTYTSGMTAMYTVDYTIDQNSVKEGDYIPVIIPADMYQAGVRLSVNQQNFKNVIDNKDGSYRLVFGPDAETAISGSFTMFVTTSETGQKTVSVGNDSKTITVNAANTESSSSGGTALGYRLNKDSYTTDGVYWGGYDYGDKKNGGAAQVALYDSSSDKVISYRVYVNGNQESLQNVTVTDTLPDGETFVDTDAITVQYIDRTHIIGSVDPSDYTVSINGKTMTVTFPGQLTQAVEILYKVNAAAGSSVRYVNNVKMTYQKAGQPGITYQDERDHILMGSNNSASNGTKSVSRTTLSESDDQHVRYSLTFWNNNGFAAGTINLTDDLNPYVQFLYADPNDYFTITDTKKRTMTDRLMTAFR